MNKKMLVLLLRLIKVNILERKILRIFGNRAVDLVAAVLAFASADKIL